MRPFQIATVYYRQAQSEYHQREQSLETPRTVWYRRLTDNFEKAQLSYTKIGNKSMNVSNTDNDCFLAESIACIDLNLLFDYKRGKSWLVIQVSFKGHPVNDSQG